MIDIECMNKNFFVNKNFVMNRYCEIAVAYAATYVAVHSAPWQCLVILKTNHSARNFLEHLESRILKNQSQSFMTIFG